jgi:hypothetical protein
MSLAPGVETNVRTISFSDCCTDGSPIFTQAPLAASTGGVTYKTGTLLAQLTAGPSIGKFINYDSVAGTNGQNVFVGVLMDNLITETTAAIPLAKIAIQLQKGAYIKEKLFYTQIADIAAAIAQRNAKVVFDYNASPAINLIYDL